MERYVRGLFEITQTEINITMDNVYRCSQSGLLVVVPGGLQIPFPGGRWNHSYQ